MEHLEQNETSANELTLSTLRIGDSLLGIDILNVQEINRNFDITPVPGTPDYIRGILNLRGNIVTIIDLGRKMGLGKVTKSKHSRNIIVDSGEEDIGLLVDGIGDVVAASAGDIEAAPSTVNSIRGTYFKGVVKNGAQLIGIVDLKHLLSLS